VARSALAGPAPRNDAVRHNPPPYFTSLSGCPASDVPYTQLATDLANENALPAFSFVTPNLIDDMHDGTVAQGLTASNRRPAAGPATRRGRRPRFRPPETAPPKAMLVHCYRD
jgi:hypothetical protein